MAIRTPRKSLAQQLGPLSQLPLTVSATVQRSQLLWRGRFQPTPISASYLARIEYSLDDGRGPRVYVESPQLEVRVGEASLPHVYEGDRLCLNLPAEWKRTDSIAKTTVPWISEWLFYYEIWRSTGDWKGGGHVQK